MDEDIHTYQDSGYGGSRNPSHGSNSEGQSGRGDGLVMSCSRPRPQPTTPNDAEMQRAPIRPIAKPIDEQTARRASDVIEQISGLLAECMLKSKKRKYLSRSKRQLPAISIRAIMLGTTIEDAKASLVIFCSDEDGAHDTIRKFLRKSFVKDLYQPNDSAMSSFDVHIFGASPSTRSSVEVGIPSSENLTYTHCGMPISITTQGFRKESAMATMGGVLQFDAPRWIHSSYRVYGLTVAHAIYPQTNSDGDDDDHFSMSDNDSDDSDDSSLNSSSESDASYPASPLQVDWGVSIEANQKARPAFPHPSLSGSVFAQPIAYSSLSNTGSFRDWALFKFPTWEVPLKPNMLVTEGKPPALLKIPSSLLDIPISRSVYIKTGFSGMKEATISAGLSQILLQPGTEFVRAYTVELSKSTDIRPGDSGSWVVDAATLEVYGHLVATDMLSCSYVIPLVDILEDIRLQVEQVSIDFPSIQPPDSQMKGRRVVLNDEHVAGHSQLFHSYKSQSDDKDSNVLNWSTSVLDIPFSDEPLKLDD
ncbi:hypothetical protein FOQG_16973 [Fusarium oxysporum f. sp. raphani 54005]|uniref:Uncharacterized protein n=2 Tax=Fusarium oxysporum f. sp. raphani TaxID=96318 RepID=X0B879_FUSOX|nr:hypothetical protein FOQG_16973 [Fusarium oxysporum f. sp. raphani 54005]